MSLLLLVLLACQTAPPGAAARDPAPSGPAAPPPGYGPPPPITLSQTPLIAGFQTLFTVGPLLPGETAHIVVSPNPGPGPCPPLLLQGDCFSVGAPVVWLGAAVGDLTYTAELAHTVTLPFSPAPVYSQAVVQHLDGTVSVTPPLERTLQDVLTVWFADAVVSDAADLAALAGVVSITGDLRIEGTSLASVDLPDLTHIGGELRVWENPDLTDLDLPSLRWVGADLSLYDDPGLTSLAGLSSLETVGGTLSLNRLDGLTDLTGLEQLQSTNLVYLFHDTNLQSLDGLDGLHTVGSKIDLWELYELQTAHLPALRVTGGRIDVFDARSLTSLQAPLLRTAGGLELHNAEALTSVGAFPSLTELGSLIVKYNDALTDLAGLEAVTTLPGGVEVRRNPQLRTLAGLDAVTTIGRDLDVHDNGALTELALPSLIEVQDLIVTHNDSLADIGLASLQTVDGDIQVGGNPPLSQCSLDALFDGLTITGTVLCMGNLDDGCSGWCSVDTGGP